MTNAVARQIMLRPMVMGSALLLIPAQAFCQPVYFNAAPETPGQLSGWRVSADAASDVEKLRTARYGAAQPGMDFYTDPVPNGFRFRWKLNKVKMRLPFNTSSVE